MTGIFNSIMGLMLLVWQYMAGVALRFGGLTGLFYGVQLISSIARNRRDMQDTILGGAGDWRCDGRFQVYQFKAH